MGSYREREREMTVGEEASHSPTQLEGGHQKGHVGREKRPLGPSPNRVADGRDRPNVVIDGPHTPQGSTDGAHAATGMVGSSRGRNMRCRPAHLHHQQRRVEAHPLTWRNRSGLDRYKSGRALRLKAIPCAVQCREHPYCIPFFLGMCSHSNKTMTPNTWSSCIMDESGVPEEDALMSVPRSQLLAMAITPIHLC